MNSTEQQKQAYKALIMVVDDNPEFLNGIELTLGMEGYQVWTAIDGQKAFDSLKATFLAEGSEGSSARVAYDRLPDLILADIMMPVMDGYEFYGHVRENPFLNDIPFIFLTAKSGDEDIRYGKGLGADDYLSKLAEPEDILASIQGKLKRIEQRRRLAFQFAGDMGKPSVGALVLIIAIAAIVAIVSCGLGIIFALNFLAS